MSDRNTRSRAANKRKLESLADSTLRHTGFDATPTVGKALAQGGSLDEPARKKLRGDINRATTFAPDLSGVLPRDLAQHIVEHKASGRVVSQVDNRIDPRKGGPYKGYQLSSTRVSGGSFDSKLKEIREPLSPNPYEGEGIYHRTHDAPYGLAGPATNAAKTVNAPGWANITVDAYIEAGAKRAVQQHGKGSTFHFRLDSHDRSSVGYAVDRKGSVVDDNKRWEVTQVQYRRKFGDRQW